ncbi:AAA family ATPase [Aliarcobacter cryaerophilus]|uniref:AAA family ATPase n=1 Tax=Aliarcobacter cryaerophilus TaxID=28198 RepID=UPI003DA65D6E
MELVYLWVEDYKNIKKQGFNFSPRFRCEYDEEKKELTINENKDYVSIFPKNINITAIVGENGSGKSRILETFTKTNSNFLFNDENDNVLNLQDKFEVSLFNDNINSYLYKNGSNVNQQILKKFTLNENSTDELQSKINNLTISFLSQMVKINPDIHFSPTHIELIFSKEITIEEINTLNGIMIVYSNTMREKDDRITISTSDLQEIKEMFEKKIQEATKIQNIKSYLLLREFIHRIKQSDNTVFKYLGNNVIYDEYDNTKSVFEYIYNQFLQKHSDENFNKIVKIIQNSVKEVFDSEKIILNYKDNNFKEIEILLVNIHRGFFNLQFFVQKKDDVLYFNDLSDGEQQLLLVFAKIYYLIRTIYKESSKELIFLIDEPDTFLHPDWQRNFVANLYKFITSIDIFKDKKFHFIVTSHSPFILSDLPKENVIFLEKYNENDDEVKKGIQKIGNCKNVTKETNIRTFGANIHILLSNGFFMKDGLMGEFAKNKISKILNFLNGKNKFIDFPINQIKPTLELIGEDFLREKLLKMYNEKFGIKSKDDEIKELKAEIERLKNAQNKI